MSCRDVSCRVVSCRGAQWRVCARAQPRVPIPRPARTRAHAPGHRHVFVGPQLLLNSLERYEILELLEDCDPTIPLLLFGTACDPSRAIEKSAKVRRYHLLPPPPNAHTHPPTLFGPNPDRIPPKSQPRAPPPPPLPPKLPSRTSPSRSLPFTTAPQCPRSTGGSHKAQPRTSPGIRAPPLQWVPERRCSFFAVMSPVWACPGQCSLLHDDMVPPTPQGCPEVPQFFGCFVKDRP